jgi:hypothetical protein
MSKKRMSVQEDARDAMREQKMGPAVAYIAKGNSTCRSNAE